MKAALHVQTGLRNGISWLKKSYASTPFKVANITENKTDHTLQLMLMSSSPGILDGDEFKLTFELEAGSSLHVQTQSYQRLYNMKQQAAQQMNVLLQPGSHFYFLPHPTVPHENSVFKSVNNFYLSDGCSLLFGEILTCGRKLSGETFLFKSYHNITRVFINGKLAIKENLLMKPAAISVGSIGQLEGFTHQASLMYVAETADLKQLIADIIHLLEAENEIDFGVTAAPVNGMIVRILGNKAEQLHDCLKKIGLITQHSTHNT